MERSLYLSRIDLMLSTFKAVALLGPRQCGKTTLARQRCNRIPDFNWELNYFDLEDPTALNRLQDPKLALQDLEGLVVIDEIQRRPDLFPVLRYLLDRPENRMQLLILGSASRDLIQQSSESLAGRLAYIEVSPFNSTEIHDPNSEKILWLRGGYPLSYLRELDEQSFLWLEEYVRSYLERDIPALGINIPSETLRRFWLMLTHNHGNILNTSELARSFGVADTTIKRYVDILTSTFMIRQLRPYVANIKKRQVKSPKIYFRDSGLFHSLMGIKSYGQLQNHIKLGASWEGFALEQIIQAHQVNPDSCHFWAIHSQAELDLLIETDTGMKAYEFKYSDAPSISKSMNIALDMLPIKTITVVTPGQDNYPLSRQVQVASLSQACRSVGRA